VQRIIARRAESGHSAGHQLQKLDLFWFGGIALLRNKATKSFVFMKQNIPASIITEHGGPKR
jgi:hypothetical protein